MVRIGVRHYRVPAKCAYLVDGFCRLDEPCRFKYLVENNPFVLAQREVDGE